MNLTKQQLKQIIKEELENILNTGGDAERMPRREPEILWQIVTSMYSEGNKKIIGCGPHFSNERKDELEEYVKTMNEEARKTGGTDRYEVSPVGSEKNCPNNK